METHNFVIAIDGPAGSGKSTTARLIATQLGAIYIDTGAMYRAVTLAALREGIADNPDKINELLAGGLQIRLEPSLNGQRTFLSDADVSADIRSAEVTAAVSFVSSIPEVRRRLVAMQREFALSGSVVMDGRDIGTVVFPDADVKIYMTADISERARRRAAELSASGNEHEIPVIAQTIEMRDRFDSSRAESPLSKSPDAVELDTTDMTVEEQAQAIIDILNNKRIA